MHVGQPAARAVEAVLALARAIQPAHDRDLGDGQVDRAVGVVEHDLDLGRRRGPARRGRRAKITSCIDCPRTASGDCSPSAHRTASVMFDLPEPFGPTITRHARRERRACVRSGKDLKPLSVSDFRCIRRSADRLWGGGAASPCHPAPLRGRLLGVLLGAPAPAADLLAATSAAPRRCGRAAGPPRRSPRRSPRSPRRASRSCSADLKSTGCSSAASISGWNASTTASAVARSRTRGSRRRSPPRSPRPARARCAMSARRPARRPRRARPPAGAPGRRAARRPPGTSAPDTAWARILVRRPAP